MNISYSGDWCRVKGQRCLEYPSNYRLKEQIRFQSAKSMANNRPLYKGTTSPGYRRLVQGESAADGMKMDLMMAHLQLLSLQVELVPPVHNADRT